MRVPLCLVRVGMKIKEKPLKVRRERINTVSYTIRNVKFRLQRDILSPTNLIKTVTNKNYFLTTLTFFPLLRPPSLPILPNRGASRKYKEGTMAEQFKVLTHNPEVSSSSPLPAGHNGVYGLLASLPAN